MGNYRLRGRNALITGGARGLGLELARLLVDGGAHVALVSRHPDELERALAELRERAPDVRLLAVPCDLTDGEAVDRMLERVQRELGPVDVLINNAGIIQVGPLDAMRLEDFEQAMKVHYFAPLRTMLGLRTGMRARGGGRVVNVSSIGGLVSVPHLLPYSASKFALVGLSEGMRSELAADGILVTTVTPGLMRTGSPRQAQIKGDHQKEYAWFAISDSLPGISMSSQRAARKIVDALERGQPTLILGVPAKLAALAHGLAPNLVGRALTLVNRLLPRSDDATLRKGHQSESRWVPSVLTRLTQRAELRNNERMA
ncbi:MAG: SDR family oxidoreductase [Polyangiales bacterium]